MDWNAVLDAALFTMLFVGVTAIVFRIGIGISHWRLNQHERRKTEESLDRDTDQDTVAVTVGPLTAPGTNTIYFTTSGTRTSGLVAPERPRLPQPLPEPEHHDGPFTGWRIMHVSYDDHLRIRLTGMYDHVWESSELDATCEVSYRPPEALGSDHCRDHLRVGACSCGIYLNAKAPLGSDLYEALASSRKVLAQCEASGVVLECEDFPHAHGYRAEHVKLIRLFINDTNPALMEYLRKTYEIPVLSLQEHATPLLKGRL